MKKQATKPLIVSCGVLISLFLIGCHNYEIMKGQNKTGKKVRYFESLQGGIFGPFEPSGEEISEEDALSRTTYCIAYYNDIGQITTFKKIYKNETLVWEEFEYHENGKLKRSKCHGAEGKVIISNYNEKGKLIGGN
jgi:hypothetical protein